MNAALEQDGRIEAASRRRRALPPPARRALLLLALGLALGASAFAAVILSSFGALTAIWPTNAIAMIALLRGPRDNGWRFGVIGVLYAGLVGAVMLAGAPPMAALALSATNLVEIGVAVILLFRFRLARADLTRPGALCGFLFCVAVAGPAAGASLGGPMVASLGAQSLAEAWWDYFSADALGAMIIAPFGMVVSRRRLRALTALTDRIWAFALFAATTAGCFYLVPQAGVSVAMLAPLMVVATLRFGVLGAASAVLWAGLLGLALSLAGLGGAGPDATGAEIRASLFHLQLGLAVLPLTTLPIAAVLAERDRALVAAAAAERARSAFLTNMSHEVRTPLNGILGLAEALARTAERPADRDLAVGIRASGETLQRLLCDVLDLARMESGEALLDSAAFDLRALGASLADETRARLTGRPIEVVLDLPDDLQALRLGPERQLRRLLAHLLDNAAKVTVEGRIVLSVRAGAGDALVLAVRDTGPGFDLEALDGLCAAFAQADASLTRSLGGAGLGLAVVRHLVEDMGGRLTLANAPEGGAVAEVALDLPRAAAAPLAADAPAAAPAPEAAAQAPDRAPRILLAEDNPANRRVVELILQMAEVELVSVENGAEAVEAFQAAPFDAVLMDVQMPVMDGLAAVRALRRLEAARAAPRTPILMLTAHALPEHRAASAAAGADAHLTKPVAAPALLEALSRALAGEALSCDSAAA
jgi:signal transduction histidine kinase/ActR/RegA family two-component response regulator